MNGVEVRIAKAATDQRVDQWARIIAEDDGKLIVRLLGTDEVREVNARDVTGVKLTKQLALLFNCDGVSRVRVSYSPS